VSRAWLQFDAGGLPFFLTDTRGEREARLPSNVEHARIMGRHQWAALRLWLRRQQRSAPERPKFIVSPSVLGVRRLRAAHAGDPAHSLRSDAWDGYPASLHRLLAFIARRQIRNVVFLSGDEHISLDATLTVAAAGMAPVAIRTIHSSGLYSPFPFANSTCDDLADDGDAFSFADPRDPARTFACSVRRRFVAGDGFATIRVSGPAAGWALDCRFHNAGATGDAPPGPPR
jgi:phosphodiesterase/alkaline phosphatase D-like protein